MNRRQYFRSTPIGDFRSGLEHRIAVDLIKQNIDYEYETRRLYYIQPAKVRTYNPDFILPNGIIIEAKGQLQTDDRTKHKYVKHWNPDLDIRFVFSNPNSKLSKGSKTRYADWCERYGFQYAAKLIPEEWLKEDDPSVVKQRWEAIEAAEEKIAQKDLDRHLNDSYKTF